MQLLWASVLALILCAIVESEQVSQTNEKQAAESQRFANNYQFIDKIFENNRKEYSVHQLYKQNNNNNNNNNNLVQKLTYPPWSSPTNPVHYQDNGRILQEQQQSTTTTTSSTSTININSSYNQTELDIIDILDILTWVNLSVLAVIGIIYILQNYDTLVWSILHLYQVSNLVNFTGIIRPVQLLVMLHEFGITNFDFFPKVVWKLAKAIDSTISINTGQKAQSLPPQLAFFDYQPSVLRESGDQILLILIWALLTLVCTGLDPCRVFRFYFNKESLLRVCDAMMLNIVFSCALRLRYADFGDAFNAVDTVLAILCLCAYVWYMYNIFVVANSLEIMLLDSKFYQQNIHYVKRQRVTTFFSRNLLLVRSLERVVLSFFVASFLDEGSAVTGIMVNVVLVFDLVVAVFAVKYPPYDETLFNQTYFVTESIKLIVLFGFYFFWSLDAADSTSFQYFLIKTYYAWAVVVLIGGCLFFFLLVQFVFTVKQIRKEHEMKKNAGELTEEQTYDLEMVSKEKLVQPVMTQQQRQSNRADFDSINYVK